MTGRLTAKRAAGAAGDVLGREFSVLFSDSFWRELKSLSTGDEN
jgi:hypothetical protein